MMRDWPSPNHDVRPCGIDMLVLHYTGMRTSLEAIDRLRSPEARVSSHYVVDEDGAIFRLVPEELRAWHAGVSFWRGRRNLNDCSIGIEIVNPGHEWGYRPFPPAQIAAVTGLCHGIVQRHAIPARNVVGHSDIAPTRKQDPGEMFPWAELAAAGVGLWPADGQAAAEMDLGAALETIGYDPAAPAEANILAFQRHWRPQTVSGIGDTGTVLRAGALLRMLAATT